MVGSWEKEMFLFIRNVCTYMCIWMNISIMHIRVLFFLISQFWKHPFSTFFFFCKHLVDQLLKMNPRVILQETSSPRCWECFVHYDGSFAPYDRMAAPQYVFHLKQQVFYRNILLSVIVSLEFEKEITIENKTCPLWESLNF